MSEPCTKTRDFRPDPTSSRSLANNPAAEEHPTAHPLPRRQRLRDKVRAERHSRVPREADQLIRFAQNWIPYGGPPPDEIMVQFGMTTARYLEALRQAIYLPDCDPSIARRIHTAYFTRRSTR
ncbi:hypothetical protein [Rhodococcus sp. ACPA1]|uniref:hypothetical protein n=1 Tax=Rhodococcus sp. ACPA1 TaxID=2028572 RepID=UPI000AC813B2|nr:hypothetical protein [Rhodococcus sp. ACPA1]PBC53646.1 hypothetical protein CJ177_31805 [Rhodococcus sp. ACPA1]RZL71216.1 MAG: hypothetical protein EOP32_40365 [Rhodococcus sp. (in: high G+C Gram-positive bacteria)]